MLRKKSWNPHNNLETSCQDVLCYLAKRIKAGVSGQVTAINVSRLIHELDPLTTLQLFHDCATLLTPGGKLFVELNPIPNAVQYEQDRAKGETFPGYHYCPQEKKCPHPEQFNIATEDIALIGRAFGLKVNIQSVEY